MKKDFYIRLCDRVDRLVYLKNSPYKLAVKLLWWIIRSSFTPENYNKKILSNEKKRGGGNIIKKEKVRFAVLLKGGIGDLAIGGVLVSKLFAYFPKESQIDICLHSVVLGKKLFNNQNFYKNIVDAETIEYRDYDAVIELDVYFPRIIYLNPNVEFIDSRVKNYISSLKSFHNTYPTITRTDRVPVRIMLMELTHKNRITCLDIDNILNISAKDLWEIYVDEKISNEIYAKWPQLKKPFITVGRSVDSTNKYSDSIRLWSVDSYNEWIDLFKKKFPEVTVVQLGISKERCESLNCDLNLLGETSFEEVLWLLKKSKLHMDGECGYVHLRHFLTNAEGKSLVLFGPTSIEIKSYPENINIRCSDSCELRYCEWMSGENWQSYCPKSQSKKALCIHSISPQDVFSQTFHELSRLMDAKL